ncbi:MAG: S-layer homology domain-containing protein, partial [Oscillospiraceae bacterium]|nr:S-layer homology domain-containing protein [Oscillospiraceae bacterium]
LALLFAFAPAVYAAGDFIDVAERDWYYAPINWTVNRGITGGIGDNMFGPNYECTREQVVTFLWADAGKPEPTSNDSPFVDVTEADWFFKPVMWAVEKGITGGITATEFGAGQPCTRGQVVTFLWAAAGKPYVETCETGFIDVSWDDWFFVPVNWALDEGITNGIGGGMFGAFYPCTRAQIATFLYAASEEYVQPAPVHSELYIEGLSVEDVIEYFDEVVLDAEFSTGDGDPSRVQEWTAPIYYMIHGSPTEADLVKLREFVAWLNTVEGFPGMYETDDFSKINLDIYFCDFQDMIDHLGDNFYGADGGVTFWYEYDEIYDATICYRTDIGQYVRNSVILEEIYNGLGPVQDTWLRTDSIIYAGYSEPQTLTEIDELILKLLYHPDIKCGMNRAACEAVIRALYY